LPPFFPRLGAALVTELLEAVRLILPSPPAAVEAFRLGAAEALEAGEALGFALAFGVLAAALALALARAFAATQAGILQNVVATSTRGEKLT